MKEEKYVPVVVNLLLIADNADNRAGNKNDIKTKLEMQRKRIETVLQKLGLAMNKIKTQFLILMSYQRKRPSRKLTGRDYTENVTITVSGTELDQKETLKTL